MKTAFEIAMEKMAAAEVAPTAADPDEQIIDIRQPLKNSKKERGRSRPSRKPEAIAARAGEVKIVAEVTVSGTNGVGVEIRCVPDVMKKAYEGGTVAPYERAAVALHNAIKQAIKATLGSKG